MIASKGNSACKVCQVKKGFHSSAVPDDNRETSPVQSRGWNGINWFFQGQVDFALSFLEAGPFCGACALLSAVPEEETKTEYWDLVYWSPAPAIRLETI